MYLSVVIRELVNVIKDSNLSVIHGLAASEAEATPSILCHFIYCASFLDAAIRIMKIVGPQAVHQMGELIDGIIYRLYQQDTGHNVRDSLLDHIISIIHVMVLHPSIYLSAVPRRE